MSTDQRYQLYESLRGIEGDQLVYTLGNGKLEVATNTIGAMVSSVDLEGRNVVPSPKSLGKPYPKPGDQNNSRGGIPIGYRQLGPTQGSPRKHGDLETQNTRKINTRNGITYAARIETESEASLVTVNHVLVGENTIRTTLEATNFSETERVLRAAPGTHPYFRIPPIEGVSPSDVLQAIKTVPDIPREDLVVPKLTKNIDFPLWEHLDESTQSVRLQIPISHTQTMEIAITPIEGFGRDAVVSFWTDDGGYICMELLSAGWNAIEDEKRDVAVLKPNDTCGFSYDLTVQIY